MQLDEMIETGRQAVALDGAVIERATRMLGDFAVNLTVAVLILVATFVAARWIAAGVRRALARLKATKHDETLQGFLVQVVRVAVLAIGLIAVLQRLGVQTASILAVLGAASLAIGLAMQGTLSNVAAGVMLLMLRPYKVGHVVTVGNHTGSVTRLDLFTTVLMDPNNHKIVVPNSKVLGDVIVNLTGQRTRRVELPIGVDYDSDLGQVFEIMRATAAAHEKVLKTPEPWAGVTDLADSAVVVTLHAFVKSDDWWPTRTDLMRQIKEAFDREGVVIPYPHQVHVEKAAPPPPKPAVLKPASRRRRAS
ncbi:mechanosensitive ion channel family protein [Brevundimonas sp. 2R-24]|uniref:Small-conductance mechanosensitive channel n=1 Tax=Peiella sedimenti TaxID=3061083 RepID=A0ABT8SLJ6_9CAUL|nr:mechanosensitive ion channel family protein [Caulobacteraceae bacterium XZ-24]